MFLEKYDFIGKLLKPGEDPTDYSDMSESETDREKNKDEWRHGDVLIFDIVLARFCQMSTLR